MEFVEVHRRPTGADVAAVRALAASVEAATGHAALSEARWIELERERRSPGSVPGFAALLARGDAGESPQEALVAYGQLGHGPAAFDLEVVAEPGPAGRGRREAVARRAVELAAESGGPIQWFVPVATGDDDRLAGSLGLARGRGLVHLRRPLPLEPDLAAAAAKVAVRAFRPGEDEATWLAVNNTAFATHPDQGGWDEATFADHRAQPWFDPAGLLMAEDGGRVVGFCWTKITPEAPAVGEIYVIGVAPGNQGSGLGAALLAAGCNHLADEGATTVVLYVDADNDPALRLYRSAGFTEDHHDVVYTARLDRVVPGERR